MMEKEKLLPVRMQVVNKPGGNGAVAAAYLAEKKGDPHTIGLFTSVWITNPLTSAEAKVTREGPDADRAAGARAGGDRGARPTRRTRRCKDFIDAAKAEARAAQAVGRLDHRAATTSCASCCRRRPARSWAFISFPGGGERIAALLGGHVNMMVIEPQEAGEHIRAGKMRVLAQVADKRLPGFPNVPTLKEAGFDVPPVPQVRGVVAPPGDPDGRRRLLGGRVRASCARPQSWKKYLEDNQFEDGFQNARRARPSSSTSSPASMRGILQEAGVKTVR